MEYIELLGCDEKIHRIKILQVILNYTEMDLKEGTKLVQYSTDNKMPSKSQITFFKVKPTFEVTNKNSTCPSGA